MWQQNKGISMGQLQLEAQNQLQLNTGKTYESQTFLEVIQLEDLIVLT